MKRVLITGANSYVGTNVEKWLMKEPDKYYVETLDMKDPNWKDFDFSKFDVVFHVAGIAHVSTKKSMKDLYFKINKDLSFETAKKSKNDGVRQFIFMSSMIVYSSHETRISDDTIPNPDNFYGQSKLDAEKIINQLSDDTFNVAVVRPPMIYGPSSKGNFKKLLKLALYIKVFPSYSNKRSMLYIDNLSMFIKYVIDNQKCGLFWPQNSEYSCTSLLIKNLAELHNKKVHLFPFFNLLISMLKHLSTTINKMFGDYYYDIKNDIFPNYISLEESLMKISKIEN